MTRCLFLAALCTLTSTVPARADAPARARKPNVIFILADDLGYAEVGCYGQKKIRTPRLDKMAAGGMRFTQFYAGNAVCAPSRCTLMTGKHPGHAIVRDNVSVSKDANGKDGQYPLPSETVTLAKLLKALGYVTGAIGKWGLGGPESIGSVNKQGFDFFFGYHGQAHAHNHYPRFVYRNADKEDLEGNTDTATGKQHTHDLFEKEALAFIKKNKDAPFFLYLPFTIPHVALQVPEDSLAEYKGLWDDPPYKGGKGYQPHPHPRAAYAAMVTRLDRTVGRILDLLRELGLEDDTLVIFTSDNGPTHDGVGGSDSLFFASAGVLRGFKGSLFEGGVRVPMICCWRGRVRPGSTSDFIGANWDFLPTLCDLTGAAVPKDTDGISILPTLLAKGEQKQHPYLYWEFHGYGGQQAVRKGDWKAIRQAMHKGILSLQLFNLKNDIGETKNVAAEHPDVVRRIEAIMTESHTPSKAFPFKVLDRGN
jgi:arylsulfatase A